MPFFRDNTLQTAHQISHGFQPDPHAEDMLPQLGGHGIKLGPDRRIDIRHRITSCRLACIASIAGRRKKDTASGKKRASETEAREFWSVPTAGSDCRPAVGQWVVR